MPTGMRPTGVNHGDPPYAIGSTCPVDQTSAPGARLQGEEVLLCVRGHGIWLESEHLDSLLDGSFPVPVLPGPSNGTGLGLVIAKRVAEHHRGSIALRSVPEGGGEFEIQLPRWRTDAK